MSFTILTGPPGPEARALAEKELRETEENVKNGIETLRKYIEEDKTLYYCTDDDFLLIFLRPCKFYPQSAYELMKRIADFRHKNAVLYYDLLPNDERDAIMNHNVINVLKTRDHKNRRVMIVQAGKTWDPSKVTSDQILRMFYLVHLIAIQEQESQAEYPNYRKLCSDIDCNAAKRKIFGTVVIMDFDGLSMKQVKGMPPSFSIKLLSFIQDAMPLRLKEVHFVKQPFLFNMVWTMFKPFVREKLRKRMFFHGTNMSSLHTHIPASHLPKNYGGEQPEIDYTSADWYPTILNYEDKIKEWNTYGYTNKK